MKNNKKFEKDGYFTKFDTLFGQIGEMKYTEAVATLHAINAQHSSPIVTSILQKIDTPPDNRDAILQAINTYTYGSVGVKNAGKNGVATLNHKKYDAVRTPATIRAESDITGRPSGVLIEEFFAKQPDHISQQLSEIEGLK